MMVCNFFQISQIANFGNPLYPFEGTLNIFKKDFAHFKSWFRDDNDTNSDPNSAFLTVTDSPWTIYSETGDSVCLKATALGKRKFCLFNRVDKRRGRWGRISKVKKGCLSDNILKADSCADILPPKGKKPNYNII